MEVLQNNSSDLWAWGSVPAGHILLNNSSVTGALIPEAVQQDGTASVSSEAGMNYQDHTGFWEEHDGCVRCNRHRLQGSSASTMDEDLSMRHSANIFLGTVIAEEKRIWARGQSPAPGRPIMRKKRSFMADGISRTAHSRLPLHSLHKAAGLGYYS